MDQYQPSESELNTFGAMFAKSQFGTVIIGTASLVLQTTLVLYGIAAFLRAPKAKRAGRSPFILISCAILLTSSIDTILDIRRVFQTLYVGGPTGKSYIEAGFRLLETEAGIDRVGDVMLLISIAIGELLMASLWRCLILWRERKWVILLPTIAWIGGIGECFWSTMIKDGADARLAGAYLYVATHIMVTFLILLRLIVTWQRTSKAFPDRKVPRMYSDVAGIILESAAPLALFGIGYIVTTSVALLYPTASIAQTATINVVDDAFSSLYFAFTALSPQMVIVRVTSGKSWKNSTESRGGAALFSQPINFAHTERDNDNSFSTDSLGRRGNLEVEV
ncbi:hypothetical protein BKA70DRAFT_1098698 [Coprinopsis sp. MPI-PUGE-AT-0042]|nr:hypothetical protein BKA70DRAFT_1098698 [Coprinopsis sp. MPI-PUGE-AT-0042]